MKKYARSTMTALTLMFLGSVAYADTYEVTEYQVCGPTGCVTVVKVVKRISDKPLPR